MRALIVLSILIVVGCSSKETVLEGQWRSDRDMTIANFTKNENLTEKRRIFLVEYLGKLNISFRGNNAKVYFDDIPEDEVDPQKFKVLAENPEFIEIQVRHSVWDKERFKYYKAGPCLYLVQSEYGYNEYFCRIEGS